MRATRAPAPAAPPLLPPPLPSPAACTERGDEAFGRDGPYAVVSQLNEAIAVGDWTLFADYRDRIEAVTAADVQAAATAILDDDRLTVAWYVPDEG